MVPPNVRTLADLGDVDHLKAAWKRVRQGLRTIRLHDFHLAHDALEYMAFEAELDQVLARLAKDLTAGSYRASAPEIIRGAKQGGLTRPLAHLTPEDCIVFIGVIQLIENALLKGTYA